MTIEEMMDIVDDDDNVLYQLTRKEAYGQNLRKRIVYAFAIDPDNYDVGLAVRAAQLSWRPLHYNPTVGGHVLAGETADMALEREMLEEIGLKKHLIFIEKFPISDPTNDAVFMDSIYAVIAGKDELTLEPTEVDRVEYMPLQAAIALAQDVKQPSHPNLLTYLNVLQKNWHLITG